MSKTKIWVTGAKGQVGKAICKEADKLTYVIYSTDRDLDITDMTEVSTFAHSFRPNIIINCAGMTDLTLCEENPLDAYRVNAIGARNLAAVSRAVGAKFVQISTDDVFDGVRQVSLNEFDTVMPITVYGKSKLAGETLVRELNPKHLIIRSSWIYGDGSHNFVSHLLETAKTRDTIQVPNDQFSCPTSAIELARCILALIETNEYGIFHASCEGMTSRYNFAKKIIKLAGLSDTVTIEPVIAASTNVGIVNRSRYTILDNLMLKLTGTYEMPAWEDALNEYMATIKK
ncbi:MAG: dTDP-4-dehydrorhamnose reductase [Lachnospiraceae bacterium]|nr:dTDP-4-dehydrorhamnose reductase [Lachnospiraceae bacterium]